MITLLTFCATVLLAVFAPTLLPALTYFLIEGALFIAFLGTAIWFIASSLWHWWFNVYIFTNKRIIYMNGFLKSTRQEQPVARIQQVGVDIETPAGLLLGFGTVTIYLAQGTIVITDAPSPARVKNGIIGIYEAFHAKQTTGGNPLRDE